MRLDKISIKFYLERGHAFPCNDLIPILHRWIREKRLPEMMIDVADYRHVHDGPKLVLVTHEANFVFDRDRGDEGLVCQRKQSLSGGPGAKIADVIASAMRCCDEIERDCGVKFCRDRLLFIVNDRLDAENSPSSMESVVPHLRTAAAGYLKGELEFSRDSIDPRDRLGIMVCTRK